MTLVRSWRSALLRASGALLLVPVGLLLAVALAAWVTGVGELGRVGQLVAGPGLPPASVEEAGRGAASTEEHLAVPLVPVSPTAAARRSGGTVFAPGSTGPSSTGRRRTSPRTRTREPARRRRTGRQPSRAPSRTPPPRTPGSGTPPVTGPPATQPPEIRQPTGVVRRIGAAVDRLVRPLPVVGPTTADAVNTVVQLVDPPPRGLVGSTGARR